MKFDITKPVNLEALREVFAAEFGNLAKVSTSSIDVPAEDYERARELYDAHNVHDITEKQRRWLEYKSHLQGTKAVLGFDQTTSYEDFVVALANDSDKVSELLWLLWLQANPPDKS